MKKILSAVLFFFLAGACLVAGFKQGGNALLGGAAIAVLFAFLGVRLLMKGRAAAPAKPAAAPAPAPAPKASPAPAPAKPAEQFRFLTFRVAGVTYRNEDRTERQVILRHIKFEDSPYVTDGTVDIHITPYDYQGEPAFKVLVNDYQIGSVPRDKVQEVRDAMDHGATVSAFDIYGGGTRNGEKLSYGCEITLRWPAI